MRACEGEARARTGGWFWMLGENDEIHKGEFGHGECRQMAAEGIICITSTLKYTKVVVDLESTN